MKITEMIKVTFLGMFLVVGMAACGDSGGGGGDATTDTTPPTKPFCESYAASCPEKLAIDNCADWWTAAAAGTDGDTAGATQACYSYHLGVAAGFDKGSDDNVLHCSHAAGAAPCVDAPPTDPFVFQDYAPELYSRVDRHGAVEAGTVGIKATAGLCLAGLSPLTLDDKGEVVPGPAVDCSVRDEYNADSPEVDVTQKWVNHPEGIGASLTALQAALKDDIEGLGLTPADIPTAVAQAGPVLIPDTIKYDPAAPVGYPNGRALTDQVVDITIAAAFLTLGTGPGLVPLDFLAKLPLNPAANDKEFKSEFPYLADPH
jgi:hypothetical protein